MKRKALGFTLIELLVVIAIIAMLAAILIPAVNSALFSAAQIQTVSNGVGIYKAVFGKSLDQVVLSAQYSAWPSNETSSTEYFKSLVADETLNVSFDYFSAKGLPGYRTSDPAGFKPDGNAWNLVNYPSPTLQTPEPKDGTPWIYTRNGPPQIPTTAGDISSQLLDVQPFGKKGFVAVLKGGSGFSMKKNQLTGENFNPTLKADGLTVVPP